MSSVLILSCSLYTCHYGERRADFCGCTCPTWEYLLMRKLVEFVNVSGLFFPLIQLCLLAGEKGLDSSHYSWLLGPLFFLNFHKLKNRFLSLSLSLSHTHTHTHTQTHRHTDTHTLLYPLIPLWPPWFISHCFFQASCCPHKLHLFLFLLSSSVCDI